MDSLNVKLKLTELFGEGESHEFYAPGRVNLIGEHIDYNGGNVFPCAINLGTYVSVRKREDKTLRLYSINFPENGIIEIDLNDLSYNPNHAWTNYIKGTLDSYAKIGHTLNSGFDAVFYGNIPTGSGLSSSASIQVAAAYMISKLFDIEISGTEIAKLVKVTENSYMGVNTGIMDQFAIAKGRKGYAMLLNTDTLDVEYVPVAIEGLKIVIMNTNKSRELITSAYNTRLEECHKALEIVKRHYDVNYLCDLNIEQLESIKSYFEDEIIYKRAHHAVSENDRTKLAVASLKNNDFITFGKLMNQSHKSLRDDYDVTGTELDTLVHTAQSMEGVYGARVTGAGYGGCAIALVKDEAIQTMIEKVSEQYLEVMGYEASFYIVTVDDGVKAI